MSQSTQQARNFPHYSTLLSFPSAVLTLSTHHRNIQYSIHPNSTQTHTSNNPPVRFHLPIRPSPSLPGTQTHPCPAAHHRQNALKRARVRAVVGNSPKKSPPKHRACLTPPTQPSQDPKTAPNPKRKFQARPAYRRAAMKRERDTDTAESGKKRQREKKCNFVECGKKGNKEYEPCLAHQ